MKKFFSILTLFLFCSTWNSQAQVQTFKAPPKFLNLTQQNTNQKILSVNSGSNVLQWVDKNSLITPTPTLQQVLTAGNGTFDKTLEMQNGSNDFSILTGFGFQARNVIVGQTKAVYLNNSIGLNIADGLGRYSVLNNTNGLYLKTTTSGFYSSLKSDLITKTDKTFQFPNQSGILALKPKGEFINNDAALLAGLIPGDLYNLPTNNGNKLIALVFQSNGLTSNIDLYGDSISTDYNGASSWINQLAVDKSLTISNYAVSGSGVKKALNSSANYMEEIPTKDQLFFTGFNNTRVLTDNGQKACIKSAYKTMLSYLYMKQIEFPYSVSTGSYMNPKYTINGVSGYTTANALSQGYCSRSLKYRSSTIPYASYYIGLNNNTTSYIQCTDLIGDNIVIGTWISNSANQSNMEIVIDGVSVMTYNGNNKYISIAGDGTDAAWVNDAIIIRGLSNTSHTVRINFKTSGKYGMIDYIGVLKNSSEAVRNAIVLSFPHMNTLGYNYTGYQTTQAILDTASAELKTEIQSNFPNYPIKFVDIHQDGLYYEPTTNPAHIQTDGIHPTTLGNTKIKDAVINSLY